MSEDIGDDKSVGVLKTPFAVQVDDAGGKRIVDYGHYGMNRPESVVPENVSTTPDEVLLFPKDDTERRIDQIRKVVATDPYIRRMREQFLQSSKYPLIEVGGESCIPLYRGLAPEWEEATTAAGLTIRGNNRDTKLNYEREYWLALEGHEAGTVDGERLVQKILSTHLVDSSFSLFVPASTSIDYVRGVHPKTQKILEIVVPLKYAVPVSHIRRQKNWAHQGFDSEQEVAIAGRIEPEWVRIVKTSSVN